MVLPSARDFFQFREAPVPPVPDGVLVPLGGAQGWLLKAEATFLEQLPHLGRVIGDTKFLPDYLGNPRPGPDLPGKPEGAGPLLQQLRELGQLAVLQFARSSRRLALPQCLGAFLPGQGCPPAHRPAETPTASATSICFQPFCSSSQARSRRASIHALECSVLSLFMSTIIPQACSNVYLFIHSNDALSFRWVNFITAFSMSFPPAMTQPAFPLIFLSAVAVAERRRRTSLGRNSNQGLESQQHPPVRQQGAVASPAP